MRVAWVIYGGLDQPTGGTLYDREVVRRLRAMGDAVEVVSLDAGARWRGLAGVALGRRLAAMRPEVVVGDELCHAELGAAFALLPRGIARVLLVHHLGQWELGAGVERARVARSEAAALWRSDAVIATSATTARRLREELGAREVAVAAPGADRLPRLPRREAGDGRVRLVAVGSWIARKRLLPLCRAFEEATRGQEGAAELLVIGDPGRDPGYAARVRAAVAMSPRLEGAVRLVGLVDEGGLAEALAGADALVSASGLEGYGMAVAEAIRAGVPALLTRGGAVDEVAGGGEAAVVCEGPAGLGEVMRRFVGDAGMRARMRAAAEARAGALPTWEEAARGVRAALASARAAAAVVSVAR